MSKYKYLFIALFAIFLFSCGSPEVELESPIADSATAVPSIEEATVEATVTVPPTPSPTTEIVPTDTLVPTATSEPTPLPTNTPTTESETVSADTVIELDVFESLEGGYSFTYPANWVAEDFLGLTLMATDEDLIGDFDPIEEGAFVMVLNTLEEELEGQSIISNLREAVGDIHPNPNAGTAQIVSGPTEQEINGYPAGQIVIEYPVDEDQSVTAMVTLFVHEGWAVSMMAVTPSAESEFYLPLFELIANSFTLMEPVVTTDDDDFFADVAGFSETVNMPIGIGETLNDVELPENAQAVFSFNGTAGSYFDIVVEPNNDFDAVLELMSSSGESLVGFVDAGYAEEEIIGFKVPSDDVYSIVVYEYIGMSGTFSVTLNEVDGSALIEGAKPIEIGQTAESIIPDGEPDLWRIGGSAGDTFFITASSDPDVDIILDIVDENRQSIIGGEVDEGYSGGKESAFVTLPNEGTYLIQISDFAGDGGNYSITVEKQ